jgi:hypothetical protein
MKKLIKDRQAGVRISSEHWKLIIEKYGSFQKYVDAKLKKEFDKKVWGQK